MTENTIVKKQVESIERATERAIQTKESALRFLREAGINSQAPRATAGQVLRPKQSK